MTPAGFPHSEISGSQLVCSSPELIAAYHVLHRLLTPRHSPSALSSLIEYLFWCTSSRSRALANASAQLRGRYINTLYSCQTSCFAVTTTASEPFGYCTSRQWLGDNRDRTGNLRRAKAALSQLSYIPRTASASLVCERARKRPGGPR
jgi:hypothetical protein